MSNKKHMPDWPCPGIEIEPGRYSGCSGGRDCPICRGDFGLATGAGNIVEHLSQAAEKPCICGPAGNTGAIPCPRHTKSILDDIGFGISEHNWQDFLESKPDAKKEDDDARRACSCGCRACEGTGWYRFGRSYKRCCTPCPVHHPDNE